MDWGEILRSFDRAAQSRHIRLEDELPRIIGRALPWVTVNDHAWDELRKQLANGRDRDDPDPDQNININRGTTMDQINLDPTTLIAWYIPPTFTGRPGLIRSEVPLSLLTMTYFEIEIINAGDDAAIGIGLVPLDYNFGNQPGWRHQSIGYHADDGGIFIQNGRASKYKEKCGTGDRMGCGIEMSDGIQFVYFTKNGHSVAEQPFDPGVELFPAVGLNSPGARVKLLNAHLWTGGGDSNQDPDLPWDDDVEDDVNVTSNPQTGHVSFLWKGVGFRDVLIPATVPFSLERAYFEIELFAFGENDDISVGLVPRGYSRRRQPGLIPHSVGFHISRGEIFMGRPISRKQQIERFTIEDKIGCGVEYQGNVLKVYFTKNGRTFWEEEIALPREVYPAVGLRSGGKTVSLCIQDFEGWKFKVKEPTAGTLPDNSCCSGDVRSCDPSAAAAGAKQSAIKFDHETCTASLNQIPGETTIATVIANKPFSADLSYFSFEFLQGDSVVVALATRDYDVEELPGCHSKSIGYHSDDGGIYQECGITNFFRDNCSHGDVLGCGVSMFDGIHHVYFTRNGKMVAEIPWGDGHEKWYPAIGMKSEIEETRIFICDDTSIWKNTPPTSHPSSSSLPSASSNCYGTVVPTTNNRLPPVDPLEALRQELNCPICWNILEKPKIFPCPQQHCYCLECLRTHVAGVLPGGVVLCPVCRQGGNNLPQRVDDLPNNPLLNRLIEACKKP